MKESISFLLDETAQSIQEGTFFVPFDTEQICLEYDLSLDYTFLVFLSVFDEKNELRFLKQLSYSEPIIQIAKTTKDTTIGGIPGPCRQGTWRVRICLFKEYVTHVLNGRSVAFHVDATDEKKEIIENIGGPSWVEDSFSYTNYDFSKVFQAKEGWYCGDLHTHTRLSDGKELPARANEKSIAMGLDFYIPTEHNVLHTGWPETNVMIVPGIEITTMIGHANLFGVDKLPENLKEILIMEPSDHLFIDIEKILKECKERNWLFSVNHPFLHVWKWLYDDLRLEDVDCLEIINDPTYEADAVACAKEANQKAVLLADLLWEEGYRICAIGGSDSHNYIEERYNNATEPSIPGDPMTSLYMKELSPKNLLQALKKCNSYVTRHCKIKTNLRFGEIFDCSEKISYEITFYEICEIPLVFYLKNGVKYECSVASFFEGEEEVFVVKGELSFDENCYNWIRFGANDAKGDFLFYANPITSGNKIPEKRTFGEIKEKLEQRWK